MNRRSVLQGILASPLAWLGWGKEKPMRIKSNLPDENHLYLKSRGGTRFCGLVPDGENKLMCIGDSGQVMLCNENEGWLKLKRDVAGNFYWEKPNWGIYANHHGMNKLPWADDLICRDKNCPICKDGDPSIDAIEFWHKQMTKCVDPPKSKRPHS
jgi:hypothetical protein